MTDDLPCPSQYTNDKMIAMTMGNYDLVALRTRIGLRRLGLSRYAGSSTTIAALPRNNCVESQGTEKGIYAG